MNENKSYQNSKEAEPSSMMFGRTALIAKAAAPYLDDELTETLELVVRISDCIETIQLLLQPKTTSILTSLLRPNRHGSTVSMASIGERAKNIDFQGLYQSIRPYLKPKELSIANQFMNFYNMKRMMDNYQMIQSMMAMMNNTDSTSGMQSDNYYQNPPPESKQPSPAPPPPPPPSPPPKQENYTDTYWNSPPPADSVPKENNADNSSPNNEQMFEMLSTMIPPEQKGALDAMKMMMDMGLFR